MALCIDAQTIGKLQAMDRHCFEKLKRPFHFTRQHASQSEINKLLAHGLAIETGVVGLYKKVPCYRLTEKGVSYGE